jgi:hypothetical protein
MRSFIERSAFWRTLNFLRIIHPYALKYNIVYPSIFAIAVASFVIFFGSPVDSFSNEGAIEKLLPLLTVLAPFYIASLAAVATFQGPDFFDKPFSMSSTVTLSVIGSRGAWEVIDVTPRHFLSLLFGYCTTVSIILIAVSIFAESIGPVALIWSPAGNYYFLTFLLFVYLFFLAQLTLFTLLGVYYLADRAHRV